MADIQFPLRISDVGKLEKLNDLCINIFTLDNNNTNIIPIRISDRERVNEERNIDLLYIVNGERSHYCLITNLAKLCRRQVTSHHGSNFLCRRCLHYCSNEGSFRAHMELCSKHEPKVTVYPKKNDRKGRDKVKFTQIARQLPLPFYFIADFECILEKFDTCLPDPNKSSTTILNRNVPCGAAYKISCTDPRFYRDPVIFIREEDGKSITEQFLDSILQDARDLREILQYKAPMKPLSPAELAEFDSPRAICHICSKHIKADEIKCKDHDHITGDYRGPSHQSCNINYQIKPDKIQIPCFFHNLKNYDAHLLIAAAKKHHGEIKVIPTTTEKYISFTIGGICFKDSYAFTQESLDALAKNLNAEQLINTRRWLERKTVTWGSSIKHNVTMQEGEEEEEEENMIDMSFTNENEMRSSESETEEDEEIDYIPEYDDVMVEFDYRRNPYIPPILTSERKKEVEDDLMLLRSKGIYAYEYFDSFDRFDERELPPIEAFSSRLNAGKGISKDEYAHAKSVFRHFKMETLQDYHNLYLIQDVLLLNDVLEAFRSICLKTYGLDPMHYHTAPGLTWDAGLKYTDVTLQLITDEEQFLFVEAGIRGGISMISHRHAQVNLPSMKGINYFNMEEPLRHLLYLDANNLYGYAMMQYLPISDFYWLSKDIIDTISNDWILAIKPDSEEGYILEIDGYIPKDKHNKFANYPIAPEAKKIRGYMLSEYQRNILRKQFSLNDDELSSRLDLDERINQHISTEKLILDLIPKEKYIVHYRTLQLYIKLGFKVTRIHRVLCFKQKAWLAPYIQANTQMRQKATSEFEKNFFKLMNNAFFGKTMENVRKRRQIDIVHTAEKLKKLVAQPTFHSVTSFREDLSAVERMKKKIVMNKPIYIGLCVLEISKWLMYDFYYNVLCQIFSPDCVQLLFTDTDSLCVSITKCENIYHQIRNAMIIQEDGQHVPAIDFFDVSEYPSEHCIFNGMTEAEIDHLKQTNKKVPGKMKDELDGNIIIEFVGLRAKAYAFKKLVLYSNEDKDEKRGDVIDVKKLKGVQKCVVKKNISFDIYKSSIYEGKTYFAETVSLHSHLHEIRTVAMQKKATGPYDDKRYILEDGISSYPYGHYNIHNA